MIIQVIVEDGGRAGDLIWAFSEEDYLRALIMFNSLVYADRDKGIMLIDGTDSVWLKKVSGRKTLWQKILRGMKLRWSE